MNLLQRIVALQVINRRVDTWNLRHIGETRFGTGVCLCAMKSGFIGVSACAGYKKARTIAGAGNHTTEREIGVS